MVDFCDQAQLLPESIRDAYLFMGQVSSSKSANYWRDISLLTGAARHAILLILENTIDPALLLKEWLPEVNFSLDDEGSTLRLSSQVSKALVRQPGWLDKIKSHLKGYLSAFSASPEQLRIQVSRDVSPAGAASARAIVPVRPNYFALEGIGKKSRRAVRTLSNAGGVSLYGSEFIQQLSAVAVSELDEFLSPNPPGVLPRALLVFDANRECFEEALALASSLYKKAIVHGVVFHQPDDGEPSLGGISNWLSERMPSLTILTAGGVPIVESDKPYPPSRMLRAFVEMLSRLYEPTGRKRLFESYDLSGLSVFGWGVSRQGARGIPSAFERAIGNAANPWAQLGDATMIEAIVSSVGQPASNLHSELRARYENIVQPLNESFRFQLDWEKRRFIYGAPIPATVMVLIKSIQPNKESTAGNIARAAQIALRSMGYETNEQEGLLPSRGFVVSDPDGKDSIVCNVLNKSGLDYIDVGAQFFLADSTETRMKIFAENTTPASILTFSDLSYLQNRDGLTWSARFLSLRATKKKRWPSVFHGVVETGIRERLFTSPERYAAHHKLQELSKYTRIDDVQVEIEKVEILQGKTLRFFGKLHLGVALTYGDKADLTETSDSYDGTFTFDASPHGSELLDADVNTDSFYL